MSGVPACTKPVWAAVILALVGCATTPDDQLREARVMPPWPPGTYDLVATVTYRSDTETGNRTESMEHRAELTVAPDETLNLSSSSGLCTRQTPDEIRRDMARGVRSFSCRQAHYVLRPVGATVGGSVRITVQEGIRTRGPCERWESTPSGGRVCKRYSWYVALRSTSKQARLRVMKR